MKSTLWIFQTEIKQNKYFFILLAATALLLGFFLGFGYESFKKIEAFGSIDQWDADIVVLPKGITLADLKTEILSGQTTAFLPEALFKTTQEMAKGQFQLGAILSLRENDKPVLFQEGESLGITWLKDQINIVSAHEQSIYSTPEWGHKVLSAFFASGPHIMMKNFKDLIDRKSVGQAFWVNEAREKAQALHRQFFSALTTVGAIILLLALGTFLLLFRWLRDRVGNTFEILDELGFERQVKAKILLSIFTSFLVVPFLIGFFCSFLSGV
ncbi:MAG: hypothetical protein ACXVB4_03295 [Pseudobdellovibrionaceae bacterium]